MANVTYVEKRLPDGQLVKTFWDRYFGDERMRFYISLGLVLVLVGLVVFSYFTAYHGQDYRDDQKQLAPRIAAPTHLFGTDEAGRDIFLRALVSAKVFFLPALLAIVISCALGTAVGIAGGGIWRGRVAGWIEFGALGLLDTLESFPKYVTLLMFITVIPQPNFFDIAALLGVMNVARMGKLIVGRIGFLKERAFVQASEALGISKLDLVLRHILFYNCLGLYIILASTLMVEVVLIEVALNYFGKVSAYGLGITVEPPMPSWGNMMEAGSNHFDAWWMTAFPVAAVVVTVLVFYMLGDSANKLFGLKRQAVD